MEIRILLFLILLMPLQMASQTICCCCSLREVGEKAEKEGNLRTAIDVWVDAKKCSDAEKCSDLDRLITSAKNKIEVEAREKGQVRQCEEEIDRLASQIDQLNDEIKEKETKNTSLSNEKEKADKKITEYEDKIWRIVDSIKNIDIYKLYCIEFPNGKYYNLAKQRSGDNPDYSTVPELVRIPGGNFQIRSTNKSGSPEQIHIKPFYLSKFEITNAQFCIFLNEMGNHIGGKSINIGAEEFGYSCKIITKGSKFKVQSSFEDHPVTFVTWYGAKRYCDWLSKKTGKTYRLPSGEEWGYAAGNGIKYTTYSWGFEPPSGKEGGNICDSTFISYYLPILQKQNGTSKINIKLTSDFSNYSDNYIFTSPVGMYSPNDFGLYDMNGNVWEWCDNGQEHSDSEGIKGGGWMAIRRIESSQDRTFKVDYYYKGSRAVGTGRYDTKVYKTASSAGSGYLEKVECRATLGFRVASE